MCTRYGDELEPKRPVEASSVLSSELFECVGSAACQQRALLHCFVCGCSLEGDDARSRALVRARPTSDRPAALRLLLREADQPFRER